MESTVTVKYKTVKHYCSCCDQKLQNPKTSKEQEFEISKEGALRWTDWKAAVEFQDDMESLVPEFIHETIRFFAANSYDKLVVEQSEIEKVRDFFNREFGGVSTNSMQLAEG